VPIECCWQKEQISPAECPFVTPEEAVLLVDRKLRFLKRCLECPRLLEDLRQPSEELAGLAEVFPYAVEEVLALRARVQAQQNQLDARAQEIKFLHEVSLVLQTSVDMDEVIAMALTAITAGQGFGLNRAILLMVDRDRQQLKGHFAVGPRHREEAAHIWQELEEHDLTLREMARQFFELKMASERERFRDLLNVLSVPLSRRDHLFVQALENQISRHILEIGRESGLDAEQRKALGVEEMILVPLISKNRRIGLLLADNLASGRPIAGEDLQSLETFALPVAFAIERASLYERLQEELDRARDANRRLRDQQETIVRMEKMALVGNMAANLAHSIRNPLTIIGGFARSLVRGTPEEDPKRRHLESIIRETRRLEEVLQEILVYSESRHPTLDLWDVNQLVAGSYTALREDLEMAGIECRLELAPALPLVKVDYKKLGYCLRGLLSGALDRLPRGSHLWLATETGPDRVRIRLADDGPELSPAAMEAAKEPGFLGTPEGKHLAYSLCQRILQTHDGHLDITTREGGGTLFTISLETPREDKHDTTAGGG
jgi:signal transduction histidine kinase